MRAYTGKKVCFKDIIFRQDKNRVFISPENFSLLIFLTEIRF